MSDKVPLQHKMSVDPKDKNPAVIDVDEIEVAQIDPNILPQMVLDHCTSINEEDSTEDQVISAIDNFLQINPQIDINALGSNGYTPMMLAIFFHCTKLAKFFLDKGADANHVAADSTSILTLTLRMLADYEHEGKYFEFLKDLLVKVGQKGEDAVIELCNHSVSEGLEYTPLFGAVACKDVNVLKTIMPYISEASLKSTTLDGSTIFITVAREEYGDDIFAKLVAKLEDRELIFAKDVHDKTALTYAVEYNQVGKLGTILDVVEKLEVESKVKNEYLEEALKLSTNEEITAILNHHLERLRDEDSPRTVISNPLASKGEDRSSSLSFP